MHGTPLPASASYPQTAVQQRFSARYTPILHRLVRRTDFTVVVADTTNTPIPNGLGAQPGLLYRAAWNPTTRTAALEMRLAGADIDVLDHMDPRHLSDLTQLSALHGAGTHLAALAAHSLITYQQVEQTQRLPPLTRYATHLFDGLHADRILLEERPGDGVWLKASGAARLADLFNELGQSVIYNAAALLTVTEAFTHLRLWNPGTTVRMTRTAAHAVGETVATQLTDLTRTVFDGPVDYDTLTTIAAQWAAIVQRCANEHGGPQPAPKPDRPDGPTPQHDHSSDCGDSDRETVEDSGQPGDTRPDDSEDADPGNEGGSASEPGQTGAEVTMAELLAASTEAAAELRAQTDADLAEQQQVEQHAAAAAQQLHSSQQRHADQQRHDADQRKHAAEQFSEEPGSDDEHGADHRPDRSAHRTPVAGWRAPTGHETGQSVALRRQLERRLWRPPSRQRQRTAAPPGTLNSRGAVAQSAQIALRKPVTANPWNRTKTVPEPPLKLVVGLAIDHSGSMAPVVNEAAATSWIIANTVRTGTGEFAAVTFGETAAPLTGPSKPLRNVPQLHANAGYEAIGDAVGLLHGTLPLTEPHTVALLIVVSDGYWVHETQNQRAQHQLKQLKDSGVALVLCNSGDINPDQTLFEHVTVDPGNLVERLTAAINQAVTAAA